MVLAKQVNFLFTNKNNCVKLKIVKSIRKNKGDNRIMSYFDKILRHDTPAYSFYM